MSPKPVTSNFAYALILPICALFPSANAAAAADSNNHSEKGDNSRIRLIHTLLFIFLCCTAILLVLALSFTNSFAQPCVPPPPGIIAWWPFDETSGTIANDIVGNNPGIYVNSPVPVPGEVNEALSFNGTIMLESLIALSGHLGQRTLRSSSGLILPVRPEVLLENLLTFLLEMMREG